MAGVAVAVAVDEVEAAAEVEEVRFGVWRTEPVSGTNTKKLQLPPTLIQKTKLRAGISIPASDLGVASDPACRTTTSWI